jgi:hypothetical protein
LNRIAHEYHLTRLTSAMEESTSANG